MGTLYLPMDNETGSLDPKSSLLSTYLEVVDENLNVVDSLELYLKPNDGHYIVSAAQGSGLDINKIDLIEHDKKAMTYSTGGQELFRFLCSNSNQGKNRLIPVGKNVMFDIMRINDQLLGKATWDRFVSYRVLDITSLALALQFKGKIPPDQGLSLGALVEFFNIKIEGNLHDAKVDTKLTMLVFKKLMEMM